MGKNRWENSAEHIGEPMSWYAMSVPYNRVLKVKSMLDAEGIEAFVPMRYEVRTVRGHKTRLYVPAVSNLLFVHTTDSRLRLFKQTTTFLQYLVRRVDGVSRKIIVPDAQMEQFMRVSRTDDDFQRHPGPYSGRCFRWGRRYFCESEGETKPAGRGADRLCFGHCRFRNLSGFD